MRDREKYNEMMRKAAELTTKLTEEQITAETVDFEKIKLIKRLRSLVIHPRSSRGW